MFDPYSVERYGRRSHRGLSLRDCMSRPRRERLGDPFRLNIVGNSGGGADGGENWQHIDTQHYVSDQRDTNPREHIGIGERQTAFQFPTRVGGKFARAMSSFANDPSASATGSGAQNNTLGPSFHQEVQQA